MIVPGAPVTGISEEYRIVKRELIRNFGGAGNRPILPRGHRVLIASANPGEGETFSAVNLALSLAVEADHDVLLRSEEHTSELQSLMRITYAVYCLKKNNTVLTNIS